MTVPTKVPDNAKDNGFAYDGDSQILLAYVAGCLPSEDPQIFKTSNS